MTYILEGSEVTTSSDDSQNTRESWLVDQITKSEFFHQKLHDYGLLEIAYAIETVQGENLEWNLDTLNISKLAWNKVIHHGIPPVLAFAHPHVLISIKRSIGYYRGLAMVSLKSMSNIGLSIERFETGQNKHPLEEDKAWATARHLNELISRLIESDEELDLREFDLWRGTTAGSTAQGSWQNRKGGIAEELVKGFIRRRIRERRLISKENDTDSQALLKDGRTLAYMSEPDIALYDENHQILVAIEIKGGIDKAGVLERIGAAIKSLSRAKQENPAAITLLIMYKVSMTYQTLEELEAHRDEIDYWLTIEDVLNRDSARQEIFKLFNI
ncbi:MAG: XcyI family restriction endonuclease [Anaerolineae bacterium]|nr:XcyI family restriction endonuclease [Anaerolineae bacterium]